MEKIVSIMEHFRSSEVQKSLAYELNTFTDYEKQVRVTHPSGKSESYTEFPVSNVLSFRFKNNYRLVMRPSGTEAKIKFYYYHHSDVAGGISDEEFREQKSKTCENLEAFHKDFQETLKSFIQ